MSKTTPDKPRVARPNPRPRVAALVKQYKKHIHAAVASLRKAGFHIPA